MKNGRPRPSSARVPGKPDGGDRRRRAMLVHGLFRLYILDLCAFCFFFAYGAKEQTVYFLPEFLIAILILFGKNFRVLSLFLGLLPGKRAASRACLSARGSLGRVRQRFAA